MSRLVLVDKPEGPTSHDVVATLRRTLGVRKAGHCGTLDPMASGLLLILTGRATRLAEVFAGHEKVYRGTVRFGFSTETDDREGKVLARADSFSLEDGAVAAALAELRERTSQSPPHYSAIKVQGVPLYKRMRSGEGAPAELPDRPVRIRRLDLLERREAEVDLEILCSAGTYVRALARDLGELLGIPAHLSALRRLASGPFRVEQAVPADRLLWEDSSDPLGLSLEDALADLPAAAVSEDYRPRLEHGAQPAPDDLDWEGPLPPAGAWVRLLAAGGELLALARVEEDPEPVLRLRRSLKT